MAKETEYWRDMVSDLRTGLIAEKTNDNNQTCPEAGDGVFVETPPTLFDSQQVHYREPGGLWKL